MIKFINLLLLLIEYPFYCFRTIFLEIPGHMNYRENYFSASLTFIVYYSLILKLISKFDLKVQTQSLFVYLSFIGLALLFYFLFFYKKRYIKINSKLKNVTIFEKIILNTVFISLILTSGYVIITWL